MFESKKSRWSKLRVFSIASTTPNSSASETSPFTAHSPDDVGGKGFNPLVTCTTKLGMSYLGQKAKAVRYLSTTEDTASFESDQKALQSSNGP